MAVDYFDISLAEEKKRKRYRMEISARRCICLPLICWDVKYVRLGCN